MASGKRKSGFTPPPCGAFAETWKKRRDDQNSLLKRAAGPPPGIAAEAKDIIAIETELNRVQSDIDAMEGRIRALRGQADFATVELTLRRKKVLGPLGYILNGLWWGIEKLFVIRD